LTSSWVDTIGADPRIHRPWVTLWRSLHSSRTAALYYAVLLPCTRVAKSIATKCRQIRSNSIFNHQHRTRFGNPPWPDTRSIHSGQPHPMSKHCHAALSRAPKRKPSMNDGFQTVRGLIAVLFFLLCSFLLGCFLLYHFLFCHLRTSLKKHSYMRTHLLSPVIVCILIACHISFNKINSGIEEFFILQVCASAPLTSIPKLFSEKSLALPTVSRYHLYW